MESGQFHRNRGYISINAHVCSVGLTDFCYGQVQSLKVRSHKVIPRYFCYVVFSSFPLQAQADFTMKNNDDMKQTIFYGNGINRLANPEINWSSIMRNVTGEDSMECKDGALTFKYERNLLQKALSRNRKRKGPFAYFEDDVKRQFHEQLLELHSGRCKYDIYASLFNIPADFFLTTNYDNIYVDGLEKAGFQIKDTHYAESVYNMRRREVWYKERDNRKITIWTIHGLCKTMKSIMLGFDHYCGSISRIGNYLDIGKIQHQKTNDDYEGYKRESTKRKRRGEKKYYPYIYYRLECDQSNSDLQFWMDTFFFSDVHIIGFAFSLDEIDLWWLLIKRMRLKLSGLNIRNRIMFYGYAEPKVRAFLEAYDVEVNNCTEIKPTKPDGWMALYKKDILKINDYITGHK